MDLLPGELIPTAASQRSRSSFPLHRKHLAEEGQPWRSACRCQSGFTPLSLRGRSSAFQIKKEDVAKALEVWSEQNQVFFWSESAGWKKYFFLPSGTRLQMPTCGQERMSRPMRTVSPGPHKQPQPLGPYPTRRAGSTQLLPVPFLLSRTVLCTSDTAPVLPEVSLFTTNISYTSKHPNKNNKFSKTKENSQPGVPVLQAAVASHPSPSTAPSRRINDSVCIRQD